jgi:hypothetical protein
VDRAGVASSGKLTLPTPSASPTRCMARKSTT